MNDWVVAALLVGGAILRLLAAIGLLRFPDLYTRMHATAKAGTLGLLLILTGVAIHFRDFQVTVYALLIGAFFFFTAPVAAHAMGRAAYLTGTPLWDRTARCDEEKPPASGGG